MDQPTLPGVDTRVRRQEPMELGTYDFTKYEVGAMVGNDMPVVVCPKCGKHAARKTTDRRVKWLHAIEFYRDEKGRTRMHTHNMCSERL